MDHRVDLDEGKKRSYIPTGINALDNALGGGMVQSGLYILAARPGCGKTAMGLQIAEKVAASGVPVLFVSLEMPTLQLTGRRLAAETGMPAARILMHSMTDEEHNAVAEASDKLRARPLMFNSVGAASVGSIGVLARQMKNCGLVIVDYERLQLGREGDWCTHTVARLSVRIGGRLWRFISSRISSQPRFHAEYVTGSPRSRVSRVWTIFHRG